MRHMGRQRRGEGGGIGRASILVAFWTLIAVTLLSALAPLGPPLSRAKGSAFNPATSEVVLRSRAHASVQAVEAERPDGRQRPPVMLLCLAALFALVLCREPTRRFTLSVRSGQHNRLRLVRACPARAPPASI